MKQPTMSKGEALLTLDERIMFRSWFERVGLYGMFKYLRTRNDATHYWRMCYGCTIDKRYTVPCKPVHRVTPDQAAEFRVWVREVRQRAIARHIAGGRCGKFQQPREFERAGLMAYKFAHGIRPDAVLRV